MFDWLKKLISPSSFEEQTDNGGVEESETVPQPDYQEPAAPSPSPPPETYSIGPQKPRTLAAELENKYLTRPLLFEPALRQYSAYRAGEPVFESESEGAHWYQLRSQVLEHILMHICQSSANEHLILRGSVLMSIWFGQEARRPGDLDWVVTPDSWTYDSKVSKDLIRSIESSLTGTVFDGDVGFYIPDKRFVSEDIWTYEKAPGTRLIVPWGCDDSAMNGTVQMDLVFGEIMPSPPALVAIDAESGATVQVSAATPEQSLAWKLLWLETDTYGQGKDLYDAVLLAENSALDSEVLRKTFQVGGVWNIRYPDPLSGFKADAIRNWYIEWEDFKKEYPSISGTEEEWKERLVNALGPLFSQVATQI